MLSSDAGGGSRPRAHEVSAEFAEVSLIGGSMPQTFFRMRTLGRHG